jgi:hypothetical protein
MLPLVTSPSAQKVDMSSLSELMPSGEAHLDKPKYLVSTSQPQSPFHQEHIHKPQGWGCLKGIVFYLPY